ncbi:MAG: hypothetical protein JWQ89_1918 [Devosia sp.]|uniref:glycosyltransferase family 2 protein n=1 Tax=Devosia sp. TaxID=1871048 RepID=UPI002602B89F|nr:glycosyltransferase family A protein [Devosia sp.]MDB5540191.1 hypothetical protein [Devosia sp.]
MARYSVLIRTYNSAATLAETLRSLSAQVVPPSQFIFVDSGSTDDCLALAPEGAIIHRYVGKEFNYSSALNQGIAYIDCDFCLVISSHTSMQHAEAMAYALDTLAADPTVGAAYFCGEVAPAPTHRLIDRKNFSGFNGMWNTCGVYRTTLLHRRPFRPEVPIAEDQEWSRWLLEEEGMKIARISGGGMKYDNPRGLPLRKWLREHLSVATFAKAEAKSWKMIARVAYRVIKPSASLRDRYFNFVLFFNLIACRIRNPRFKSRYW